MIESLNKSVIWYLTNFYGFFAKRQGIANSGKLKTLMPKFGVKPNVSGSYFSSSIEVIPNWYKHSALSFSISINSNVSVLPSNSIKKSLPTTVLSFSL